MIKWDSWISKLEQLIQPAWLQYHPTNFLDKPFNESEKGINTLMSGGYNSNIRLNDSLPNITEQQLSKKNNELYCKLILAQDSFFTPSATNTPANLYFLANLFDKYKFYPTNNPLQMIEQIVLISHH